MNIDAEALSLMAKGKRHLLIQDFNSAVQFLEQACRLYDEKYGVNADECADAYLNYGAALLELHRQESVVDGLVNSKPSNSDNEEDGEEDEEIEEDESKIDEQADESTAVDENNENGNSKTVETNDEEDISVSPTPPNEQTDNNSTSNNGVSEVASSSVTNSNGNASTTVDDKQTMETDVDPNQPSTSTGITNENREEDEDDATPSNIEVAFEVLTMAKQIYKRQTEYRDDAFMKLSDALQKLGEILIEWENNTDALNELDECLEIRKRHLPDDDRLIAEAYYHIGLTHSFIPNIQEANANFQKGVDVIEQRLNRLKNSYTSETNNETRLKIEDEIKDLENVLPEMKAKIEDTTAEMTSTKLAAAVEQDDKLEEEKLAEKKKQIQAKPISNVTHLVKRKREDANEAETSKKLKNGNENGTSNNVEMKDD